MCIDAHCVLVVSRHRLIVSSSDASFNILPGVARKICRMNAMGEGFAQRRRWNFLSHGIRSVVMRRLVWSWLAREIEVGSARVWTGASVRLSTSRARSCP